MNEMMELMHQLLLGNGILIAGCVYVCAELLKSFLPRMNSTWIPLIGAIMGVNLLGFFAVLAGTLATFLAALLTWKFRKLCVKGLPLVSALMPVLFNAVIVGAELAYVLYPTALVTGFMINALEVGFGELIACFVLGLPLVKALDKAQVARRFGL